MAIPRAFCHQRRSLGTVYRPPDNPPRKRAPRQQNSRPCLYGIFARSISAAMSHDAASLRLSVMSVTHSAGELAVDQIAGGRNLMLRTCPFVSRKSLNASSSHQQLDTAVSNSNTVTKD